MALAPGDEIKGLQGTYRVKEAHGEGSFGVTFRARDVSRGTEVIVKQLRIEKLDDWKALELFEREGRVLASLSHPNIPAFRDFFAFGAPEPVAVGAMSSYAGAEALSLVLVQQFIEGATLQQRIDDGRPLTPDEATQVLPPLLQALRHLHERSPPLVHRDIKPGNVILTPDGQPYLVDFGAIQERLRGAGSVGSTIVGTLGYMPLEQTRGQARPASDLYALGVTMIVALAGRPLDEIPVDESTGKIALDRALPADTPGPLRHALDSMVEVLVAQRAQSASEVLDRLRRREPRAELRVARATPPPYAPDSGFTTVPAERRRLLLVVAAGMTLACAGGMAFHAVGQSSPRTAVNCNPPYVYDSAGHKVPKKECASPPSAHVVSSSRLADDCRPGTTRGCVALGDRFVRRSDFTHALDAYAMACAGRDGSACNTLGTVYAYARWGEGKDEARASELYKQACTLGDALGCNHAGWSYVAGRGIPKDIPLGVSTFKKACDLGTQFGCDSYAWAMLSGQSVPRDDAQAFRLIDGACKGGVQESCVVVGFLYRFGRGTLRDDAKAQEEWKLGCPAAGVAAMESQCAHADIEPEECGVAGLELMTGACGQTDVARAGPLLAKACLDGWSWACEVTNTGK